MRAIAFACCVLFGCKDKAAPARQHQSDSQSRMEMAKSPLVPSSLPPPPEPSHPAGRQSDGANEVPATPPSDLPVTLLATLAASDPRLGRATIRRIEQGLTSTVRVGEALLPGAVLSAVHAQYVLIERDGELERLDFPTEQVELGADEKYYPDFVEFGDRERSMANAVQLPAGIGYMIKRPDSAWGTPRAIGLLRESIRIYGDKGLAGPDVHVGDLSRRNGGPFPPHLSHQTGRDVDIGYVLKGPLSEETRFRTATRHSLDLPRTWALLEAHIASGGVAYIFMDYGLQRLVFNYAKEAGVPAPTLAETFQYPRGSRSASGTIRHWRGHANHFHVRFRR